MVMCYPLPSRCLSYYDWYQTWLDATPFRPLVLSLVIKAHPFLNKQCSYFKLEEKEGRRFIALCWSIETNWCKPLNLSWLFALPFAFKTDHASHLFFPQQSSIIFAILFPPPLLILFLQGGILAPFSAVFSCLFQIFHTLLISFLLRIAAVMAKIELNERIVIRVLVVGTHCLLLSLLLVVIKGVHCFCCCVESFISLCLLDLVSGVLTHGWLH